MTTWPADTAAVVRWVRSALRRASQESGEIALTGLEDVEITAALTGYDLEHLTLDATGTKITIDLQSPPVPATARTTEASEPEIIARERGTAKSFRVTARPVRIERSPLHVDVQAFDVPILWLTAAEPADPAVPESIHALVPDDDQGRLSGTFRVAIATKDLAPLIASTARPMLREGGVRLGRLRLDVRGSGAAGLRIDAYAGLRWKLLMVSVRAEARIEVSRDAVITIRDLALGSRNLLVKVALLFARKHVRRVIGRTIDLNQAIAEDGTSIRVHDLRVDAGEQLSIEGRFG